MSKLNIWRNSGILCLGLALAFGLALFIGLLLVMGAVHTPDVALAQGPNTRYVDSATGNDSGNYCTNSGAPCATIQHAVDVADPGDEIRVATGIYTDVQARTGITQVVYISQTVALRGGYTTTDWSTPYPITQPTTLDAQRRGRVLYITGDISPIIEGLRIAHGEATELGGDPSDKDAGGGVYVITATATIRNSHVLSSTAFVGGGLYFQNGNETLLVDNLISGNSTAQYGSGGGLYFDNSAHVTLTGNTISSNEAGPLLYGFGTGGGTLFDNSPSATLSDNIISDNRASWGGGLKFRNSSTATLIANTISNNVADHLGWGMKHCGGVWFDHSDNATLIGNTVSGNRTANNCGGVCFSISHNAVLTGNVIISNTRGPPPWWDGFGAGVYLRNSKNTSLISNTISHNTGWDIDMLGTILGGGLYIGSNSTVALISNTISSNGATRGGGLYVDSNSIVTLTSNTITGNAVYSSCGKWCYDPVGCGGGLHLSNSTATLSNTVIADNQVETAGGGLYVERSDITLTNSIVADNQITLTGQITGSGSGLYIAGSSPHLLHTTIARNSGGDGSGVYITDTTNTAFLTNTILVSHTVGITVAADNTATLNGVLWYSNTTNTGGGGHITVTNEYTGNPAFAADGYHLTASSEAIDKVVSAGVDDDIDGDPRPIFTTVTIGTGYDLGADEFPAALSVTKQADSDPVQAGEQLTYTLRVANTGNVTLTATITDILPQHVTPTGIRVWTETIAASSGVWTKQFTVTVETGYSGTLTNVVQVTTEEGATGIYTETSTAEVTPALDVTKQADPDPVTPGSPLTYTIRVTNTGNVTLTATITDILPQHVTPTGIQVWTETITAPGGVWTEQFTVTAKIGYSGTLTNVVQVTTDQGATGIYTKTATVVGYSIYLPVILK